MHTMQHRFMVEFVLHQYMIHQESTNREADALPTELSSPQAKLVYLYIEAAGSATVDDLTEALSMKKIAVLSVLRSLTADGLVDRDGSHFVVEN